MECGTVLEAALNYTAIGLAVIPLHGKKPYFESWPDVATKDAAQVRKWWAQDPSANVGIVTGRKSNVFVLDVDPKNGGTESIESLFAKYGRFTGTWTATTGSGGTHYFFRYPALAIDNRTGLLPGIDIRGNGGQVVASPSIHPETHRRYMWDGLREPWDDPHGLAEAPEWLLDMLLPKERTGPAAPIPLKIPKGVQHQTLVSLAGQLRRLGLTPDEIFPSLMEINQTRCTEPGPERNIRAIAQSMAKYQPHDRNLYAEASKLWRLTNYLEHKNAEQMEAMQPVDGLSLLRANLTPVHEVIQGMLYNGLTILAGAPKSGKSYLVLGMSIAVACGGRFLSAKHINSPGHVAYFALEESQRRTSNRLHQLTFEENERIQNIEFLYSLRSMMSGGLQDLETYIEKRRPSLVVIDTLMAFVTGDRNSRRDVFRDDYREIKALQEMAAKYETAIMVVHHTNKLGGGGIASVAGTGGITAAADCIWVMQRQPGRRAVVEITGREVEDQSLLIELELAEPVGWFLIEQGEDVVLSGERQVILEVLRSGEAKTPKQLASEIGKSPMATRQLLRRMLGAGQIAQDGRGNYRLPISQDPPNRYGRDE